jgi:hypothetical protein
MTKYGIFQLDCYNNRSSEKYLFLKNFCAVSVENYCKKYNIEYNILDYTLNTPFSYKEKNQAFIKIANNTRYEKSLFLDLDIYISKFSPSIFDIEFEHIAGCLAMHYRLQEGIDHVKDCLGNKISDYDYFRLLNCSIRPNGGVLLFNNKHNLGTYFLKDHIENGLYQDEMFLSYKIANRNLNFNIIPDIWNNRSLYKSSIEKSYFTHILSHSFINDQGIDTKRDITLENIKKLCKNI